jgi:hypothetical protein
VPADLADGVDDVLADLLRDGLQLIVVEPMEIPRPVDPLQELVHQ